MNLWQVIHNEGIGNMFIHVCLDNFTAEQIASLSITYIPAIVISHENQPNVVYEGSQKCSHWLTNFTMNRRRNLRSQVETQMKLIQKEHATARTTGDCVLEYIDGEMDGVNDDYAYTNTDLCQPKRFVQVGNEDANNIVTPQVKDSIIDANLMNKQITQLETNRNKDTHDLMKIMEQNQIETIIKKNMQHN